jgi:hypothetical protein
MVARFALLLRARRWPLLGAVVMASLITLGAVLWQRWDSRDSAPSSSGCPVDEEICVFAREKEALLQARDITAFLTPSQFQRSGDIASFTTWLDGALPATEDWEPQLVSVGCPVVGDPPGPSCADAFALAFSTLGDDDTGGTTGLGEFLYRRVGAGDGRSSRSAKHARAGRARPRGDLRRRGVIAQGLPGVRPAARGHDGPVVPAGGMSGRETR